MRWRKSSRSGGGEGDNCVEVAFWQGAVAIRDSKNRAGAHLSFDQLTWASGLHVFKTHKPGS